MGRAHFLEITKSTNFELLDCLPLALAPIAVFQMNAEKTCEQKITSALDYLSKSGLRLTAARRSLLDLLGDSDRPLSVEEISERSDGRFDLVTVYRNMGVFAELGVVQSGGKKKGRT